MSEFVGVQERWVERGWTRKQMRDRIEELGLKLNSWCVLQPYELNFMQNPNANQNVLEDVESGERAIGAENLWKPGETITVSFDKSTTVPNLESLVKKYVMQDVQPYVSVKFKFVDSGGQVVVNTNANRTGSTIGKVHSGSQQVGLNEEFFKSVDVLKKEMVARQGKKVKLTDKPFNYIRYIIVHEFGHTLGLHHQFQRDLCKQSKVPCTDDPQSVMNFPLGFSLGSYDGIESTMDHFSPGDIKWLKTVYPPP